MADKTLATFRIEPPEWEVFKSLANSQGSNASALLLEFVRWHLAGNRIHPDATPAPTTHLDNVDDKIDERISACLDKVLDTKLYELRDQLLEELRGKLKAR